MPAIAATPKRATAGRTAAPITIGQPTETPVSPSASALKRLPTPVGQTLPRGINAAGTLRDASGSFTTGPRLAAPVKVLGDGTTIYGFPISASNWTSPQYGIYSFKAAENPNPTRVVEFSSYEANGGGCYVDGKFYYNSYVYTEEMGYTFTTFLTYDLATGQLTKQTQGFINDTFNLSQITNDMTYDPVSDRILVLSYIAVEEADGLITKYYPSISEIDRHTGMVSPIARIPQMAAIACSQSGVLYGVTMGKNSRLCRIDKQSGDITEIGSTGLDVNYTQSMTFDPVTDILYWAAVTSTGNTGLYTLDLASGAASKICNFPNNEEFTSLYIPAPEVKEAAPAKVSEITPSFTNGSLSGKLIVKTPELTFAGSKLSGKVTLKVDVDGVEKYNSQVNAGQSVEIPLTLAEGTHSFAAMAENAAGAGPRTGVAAYVGIDAPAQPSNITIATDDKGRAIISWSAPTAGRHGGYIDPAQITYNVTRMPDGAEVAKGISATSAIDPLEVDASNYYYTVTPYIGQREGLSANSETRLLGGGSALPVKWDLSTHEQFDLFTTIDANNDAEPQYHWGEWMYGYDFPSIKDESEKRSVVYGYSPENAADDWVITPPVKLKKGKKYRLTYTMWTRGDKEILEVTVGTANDVASQRVITAAKEYTHKDHKVFTQDFTAEADGNHYAGFHITSGKKKYYLFVTDIMVDEVPDDHAPAAVDNLTATAGAKGAMTATVSFKAPSKTMAGTALSTISKIEVYRGNAQEACHSFASPKPGADLTWTDTDPAPGFNTYRVVAFAGESAGQKAETTLFVGVDTPLPPTDIAVSDASGKPVITWTAPTQGVNGGYIDPAALTYIIYRDGDSAEFLNNAFKGTEYTDTGLDPKEMQHFVRYAVFAVSKTGRSEFAVTDFIVYGDPYAAPFAESFADSYSQNNPWVTYNLKGNQQLWTLSSSSDSPACSSADSDGGMLCFQSGFGRIGDESRIVSPKISLAGLSRPLLTFYFYHKYSEEHEYYQEQHQDRLIPEVQLPDGSYEALLETPIFVDDLGQGWLKYALPLDKYKTQPYVRIAFHGISDGQQNVNVDIVRITNDIQKDIQLYTLSGPAKVKVGKKAVYTATFFNRGSLPATGFKIQLLQNGKKIDEYSPKTLESGEYASFDFPVEFTMDQLDKNLQFQAKVEWDEDEIEADNLSNTVTTRVVEPDLPEVYALRHSVNDHDVTLEWGAPEARHYEEGFEDYTPFSINNIEDYTLVDNDKSLSYCFRDIYFDHAGDPQAFMVFNPVMLGINIVDDPLFGYDAFDPHGGQQVLCAWGAAEKANDDWFISPEVFGNQKVTFYAKSGDYMQGKDTFEILYSTSDTNIGSFRTVGDAVATDKEWKKYEIDLPANARYFAIHCTSADGFCLMIDDLTYVAKAAESLVPLTGYAIYRDGFKVGETGVDVTTFTDRSLPDGTYTYDIRALYGTRTAPASDKAVVVIGTGAVDQIAADAADAEYFTLAGFRAQRPLQPGVYIELRQGKARKVIVK